MLQGNVKVTKATRYDSRRLSRGLIGSKKSYIWEIPENREVNPFNINS